MSDMSASVILKLVDDLSAPARKAHKSLFDLTRDIQRLGKINLRSSGIAKQVQSIEKATKAAASSIGKLRTAANRPIGGGFGRSTKGFTSVTNAANKATQAVQKLQARMKAGGSFNNRGGFGGGGGGGGRGGHGGSARWGGGGHGLGIGKAFAHVGVYEAVHKGIELTAETVKSGFEQVFEAEHTKSMLAIQGESMGMIDAAVAQSRKMAKDIPSFTSAQHLESIAELRPALLGGLKEAIDLAPMFQKSISILEAAKQGAGAKALSGANTHGEALSLVRALEVKNVTTLGDQAMESYVDGITKAIVSFNGQIKAEDFHSAFKFSRGDSVNWSKEFSTEILPTLMNELKKSSKTDASQTGNALKSMSRVVMDGVMTPDVMAKWDALHMFAPGAITKDKKGKIKKDPNHIGGAMLGANVWQAKGRDGVPPVLTPLAAPQKGSSSIWDWLFPPAHADTLPDYMRRKNPIGNLSVTANNPFSTGAASPTVPVTLETSGVTAQMTALMAALAAIAAAGIRIPVTADTSGVTTAVAGAVAAGRAGAQSISVVQHIHGTSDPKATAIEAHNRFSAALNDIA